MNLPRTNRPRSHTFTSIGLSFALAASAMALSATPAGAQCTEIVSDLREPIGSALTNQGNLLVSENGTTDVLAGRISIVDPSGNRRTLLDGLPSAISDIGEPSGPKGLIVRGRNLYVLIGTGDVGIAGPLPGTTLENPNGPSSPIFASILAIHVSAAVENHTSGFTLTLSDQEALADGQRITLSNGGRDQIILQLVADFPNFIPFPLPDVPDNIQLSNPFGLVARDHSLFVTDGGRNLVWEVDLLTDSFSGLVAFPDIPNPLFPTLGGPFLQAVPTGISGSDGQLLVTLLRGAPFPTGTSTVEQIDPASGSDTVFISNLTTAIDIIPVKIAGATTSFVLEHSSFGPFFAGPGRVLRYDNPADPPTVVADCLTRPSSMTLDRRTRTLYVTEIDGSVVTVPAY